MANSKLSLSLATATLIASLAVMPSSYAMRVDGASKDDGKLVLIEEPMQAEEKKAVAKRKAPAKKAVKKAPAKKKAAKKAPAKKKAARKKAVTKKAAAVRKALAKKVPASAPKGDSKGSTTSLPEPSSFILLLAGFFAVGALVRRRANQA
jgi:hypothetical protein